MQSGEDVTSDEWSEFWSEYSQEYYDYIALLTENKRLLDRVAELSGTGSQVLDAGCGTGNLTIRLAKRHQQVTAIDFSEGMVNTARAKTQQFSNVTVARGDVTDIAFPTASFDAVTSVNVLYNIINTEQAIKEMCRVLKPGGKLVICSPLAGRSFSEEQKERVKNDCIANGLNLEQMDKCWKFQFRLLKDGGFKYLPTEAEISNLLTSNGFQIQLQEEAYYDTNFLIQAEKC